METLPNNIPSIIFWDPNYWELKLSANHYFKKLKEVGIFHNTPLSAAQQLNKIQGDISNWWQKDAVQDARKEFCKNFAHFEKDYVLKLAKTINE